VIFDDAFDDLVASLRRVGQIAVNDMRGEDSLDTCAHVEHMMRAVLHAHRARGDVAATARSKNVIHVDITNLECHDE
jgi:hypothetical protein